MCTKKLVPVGSLCEGEIMRRNLLLAVLACLAVGMTGCIIIDTAKVRSHTPATVRTEQCAIHQSLGIEEPVK